MSAHGVVFDSVQMRPLSGATVQLIDLRDPARVHTSISTSTGEFSFDSLSAGVWLIGFFHSSYDVFNVDARLTRVEVRDGDIARVELATPSPTTLLEKFCGVSPGQSATGAIFGKVRSSRYGELPSSGQIEAQWPDVSFADIRLEQRVAAANAAISRSGAYLLCGLPLGATMGVRATVGTERSGLLALDIPQSGLLQQDILVGTSAPSQSLGADVADSSMLRSPPNDAGEIGRVRGVVRAPGGERIAGARVALLGSSVESTTDGNGAFALDGLPTGTGTLQARMIGFAVVRRTVDIEPERTFVADLTFQTRVTVLSTNRVEGRALFLANQMREFEERRRFGFGHFIDEREIERRNPVFLRNLLEAIPGVLLLPNREGGYRVAMRSISLRDGLTCAPTVFVDGVRISKEEKDLESYANIADVRAVEVYTRPSQVPLEFSAQEGCGAVIIHSGQRASTK